MASSSPAFQMTAASTPLTGRRRMALSLGCLGVVAVTSLSSKPANGFLAPRVRGLAQLSVLSDAAAEQPTLQSFEPAPGTSSFVSLLPLAIGIALVGASRSLRSREANVACEVRARRRWQKVYGGEGPPQTPEWLLEPPVEGATMPGGLERPAWLTLQKWQSFVAKNRARSPRWWVQAHDENGFPAFDPTQAYTIEEAVDIQLAMNERAPLKSDPSIEAHMQMNLDPRFPDQIVRTAISLPHGTGKQVKVAVFCTDEDGEEVKAAGAYKWGSELADEIAKENLDFDVLLAKPQMMPKLAKLGKILGPRRLMPSPKSGTVVTDYAKSIKEFQGGKLELRTDKSSLVQCAAGRLSFGRSKLIENFKALLKEMAEKRPQGAKQQFWKSVFLGSTQTPSINIKESEFPAIVVHKK